MNVKEIRSLFLLDPDVIFLNHGSFGACPRPVFETYQSWQRELERQPVAFLGRRASALLAESRAGLAAWLGATADDVVYFPNPTTALNAVARSLIPYSQQETPLALERETERKRGRPLDLRPGDEILTSNHEYGALDRTWRFICQRTGARYVQQVIPLPVTSHAEFVERLWGGVTGRTRIIFLSHITSPTALIFPVTEICRRARGAGILTIVDGAHAPGQIPLDLTDVGADIYTGACHKWLCAPKGSAFLYVRPEVQPLLEPLVISWGWESDQPGPSRFIDHHEWQGTRDLAAFLAVPAAIEFQARHDWETVRRRCHALALATRARIAALTGLEPLCPEEADRRPATDDHARPSSWLGQFFAAELPAGTDTETLKQRLYDDYRIEAPVYRWAGRPFIRVSFQAYNDEADADALVCALSRLL